MSSSTLNTFTPFNKALLTLLIQQKPKSKAAPKAAPKTAAKSAPKKVSKAAPKKMIQSTLSTKAATKKRSMPESDDDESGAGEVLSHLSNTPPSAKKQRTVPAAKKTAGNPLVEITNDSFLMDVDQPASGATSKKKTDSEKYQRLTHIEHIIKRSDMYIGSIERTDQMMWVFNKETTQMEHRTVSYVPGLYKIFDEILVNAADNKQRDPNMTYLKVNIDRATGIISVENNGKGIPVVMHEVCHFFFLFLFLGRLCSVSPPIYSL